MFTKFQIKKLDHHFNIIDFNKDGLLTREDLYNHGQAYADLINVPAEGYIKKEIEWWNKMNFCLGIYKTEKFLTRDEHKKAFEYVMFHSCFLQNFLWDYMILIWHSSKLSLSDPMPYKQFTSVMLSEDNEDAIHIFKLLDVGKREALYIYEIYHYWLNYFYSSNESCPSKWIFGKF